MKINPRIITELHGNLPDEFFTTLNDKIFYREYFTEAGMSVWIPKESITNCIESDIISMPIYLELKSAFEKHPEYDSIILSNT